MGSGFNPGFSSAPGTLDKRLINNPPFPAAIPGEIPPVGVRKKATNGYGTIPPIGSGIMSSPQELAMAQFGQSTFVPPPPPPMPVMRAPSPPPMVVQQPVVVQQPAPVVIQQPSQVVSVTQAPAISSVSRPVRVSYNVGPATVIPGPVSVRRSVTTTSGPVVTGPVTTQVIQQPVQALRTSQVVAAAPAIPVIATAPAAQVVTTAPQQVSTTTSYIAQPVFAGGAPGYVAGPTPASAYQSSQNIGLPGYAGGTHGYSNPNPMTPGSVATRPGRTSNIGGTTLSGGNPYTAGAINKGASGYNTFNNAKTTAQGSLYSKSYLPANNLGGTLDNMGTTASNLSTNVYNPPLATPAQTYYNNVSAGLAPAPRGFNAVSSTQAGVQGPGITAYPQTRPF